MTHNELRQQCLTGGRLEACACPGELDLVDTIDDPSSDPPGPVRIYHCRLCGHTIAVDATDGGRVRNDYPDTRAFVWDLLRGLVTSVRAPASPRNPDRSPLAGRPDDR